MPAFQKSKTVKEKTKFNFQVPNDEAYNRPFSEAEFRAALSSRKGSAPGPDEIHYEMLENMHNSASAFFLKLFNRIWREGDFPTEWGKAVIIPVPKEGKDSSQPGNYRPIALTSCVCKLMERMVTTRLSWTLEWRGQLAPTQSGFRRYRSTTDPLLSLHHDISQAMSENHFLLAVFFDIQKAYDTTWRWNVLRVLDSLGFKGHLPTFVQNFLRH